MTETLKIIIADDEQHIRLGLKNALDWEKYGCIVEAVAEDGEEALEKARMCKPDIIITDINMPFVNGLEFCRRIRQEVPDIEIIILTGYDEFEYARQAVQLGVREFLVKPVSEKKLLEVLQKSIDNIRKIKFQRQYVESMEHQLEEFMPSMKEQFLQELLKGQIVQDEIDSKVRYFNICKNDKLLRVFIVNIDNYDSHVEQNDERRRQIVILSIRNIVQDYIVPDGYYAGIWEGQGRIAFILGFERNSDIDELTMSLAEHTKKNIRDRLDVSASIGIGGVCAEFYQIPKSYYEALNALNYSLVLGDGSILDYNFLEQCSSTPCITSFSKEMELYNNLMIGNQVKVKELLAIIYEDLKKSGNASVDYIKVIYLQILITSARITSEVLHNDGNDSINFSHCFYKILKQSTLREIDEFTLDVLINVCNRISEIRYSKYFKIIEKAKNYVFENYSGPLTLQNIASHVHMAPSYFSYIFKKETSENWSSFLTNVRIEKAKELLKNSEIKTYEIAFLVGFNEPNYFSNQFKKVTGYSPSDYKTLGIKVDQV